MLTVKVYPDRTNGKVDQLINFDKVYAQTSVGLREVYALQWDAELAFWVIRIKGEPAQVLGEPIVVIGSNLIG